MNIPVSHYPGMLQVSSVPASQCSPQTLDPVVMKHSTVPLVRRRSQALHRVECPLSIGGGGGKRIYPDRSARLLSVVFMSQAQ